jgi:hypothetical protein
MANGNTKPAKKYQAGAVSLAVWKNVYIDGNKDGREGVMYSVNLERRYKDRAGNWQSTGSFHANDIPKAVLLLQKAYEFIVLEAASENVDDNGGERV